MDILDRIINDTSIEIPDGMKRQENIIVLPRNTLRLIDVPLQLELYEINGDKIPDMTLRQFTYKICTRIKKIHEINNVSKETIDELVNLEFHTLYANAPRTDMYDILEVLRVQKFVDNITILFPNKSIKEDSNYKVDYYDGTYTSLLSYLKNNNFTCLILDDVDLLLKLCEDEVDFNFKTIFLTKIGYNYMRDKGSGHLVLKHFNEISNKYYCEIYTISPYTFNSEDKI